MDTLLCGSEIHFPVDVEVTVTVSTGYAVALQQKIDVGQHYAWDHLKLA